jgi:lipoyl(octanoyl) transferase
VTEAEPTTGIPLRAYLLGTLGHDPATALQRRLAYEAGERPPTAAVLICDHSPGITIGRAGSAGHVRLDADQLVARRWPVRWVARGGGVTLHVPGQVACYPVLPLGPLGRTPAGYVAELCQVVAEVVRGFGLTPEVGGDAATVRVNGRRVATVGVSVRNGVTTGGVVVNVSPDLKLFRDIACDADPVPMTSLQRESAARVRVQAVRQRLLEAVHARFRLGRLSVFHSHPSTGPTRHASVVSHR